MRRKCLGEIAIGAGRRHIHEPPTATRLDRAVRHFGGLAIGHIVAEDCSATVIDDHQAVFPAVAGCRGNEGFEQPGTLFLLLLCQRLFNLPGSGGDKGRVVGAEDRRIA